MTQRTKKQTNSNGVVLHESSDVVIIATGITAKSTNSKTGGMIQVYILHRTIHPVTAVKTGSDSTICGDCKHRGEMIDGRLKNRRCYVQVGKGPAGVWKCYQRGGYRAIDQSEYAAIFGGRTVRFGAYGDPAYMPQVVIAGIVAVCKRHTGYTHQWKSNAWLRPYVMASCDSSAEASQALANGWRYFRVAPLGDAAKLASEISCPASAEAGKRTTCEHCALCDGAKPNDKRKSIVIQDHSVIAKSSPLIQISL